MRNESERLKAKFGKPFESQLDAMPNGCIIWTGKLDKDGYGSRGSRYGERRAHRHAYHLKHGPIPKGSVVRHTCDNPKCCNPDHLILGSHVDNIQDKVIRDRQAKGARIARAKLTEEMVLEIRRLHASGVKQMEIANMFPVTQSSVSLIVLRKQWTHI